MSMKQKLESKLAQGVRQVQLKRDAAPAAAPVVPAKTAKAKPASTSVKSVTAASEQQPPASTGKLHPRRIWPD